MLTERIRIENIPAIIWGAKSKKVYLFVHGKMSKKEEAVGFAEIAVKNGYQVLSFDLPEHGERINENTPCNVQNGVHDLSIVYEYVNKKWENKSLFASSLGAYFSLVAYKNLYFEKCLFLSPILDMERLIRNMMIWFNVTEPQLQDKKEIPTPMGETLSWDYFEYVKKHPINKWDSKTYIIFGEKDNVTEKAVLDCFVQKYKANVEIVKNGEHYFQTKEQIEALNKWIMQNV